MSSLPVLWPRRSVRSVESGEDTQGRGHAFGDVLPVIGLFPEHQINEHLVTYRLADVNRCQKRLSGIIYPPGSTAGGRAKASRFGIAARSLPFDIGDILEARVDALRSCRDDRAIERRGPFRNRPWSRLRELRMDRCGVERRHRPQNWRLPSVPSGRGPPRVLTDSRIRWRSVSRRGARVIRP